VRDVLKHLHLMQVSNTIELPFLVKKFDSFSQFCFSNNKTEWSSIRSVIILASGLQSVTHRMYDRGQRVSAQAALEQVVAFKNRRFEDYNERL